MASVKVYGGGTNMDLLAQQEKLRPLEQEAFQSHWIPSNSSPSFNGTKSIISFEDVHGGERNEIPYFQGVVKDEENGDEEEFDGCGHKGGKKRRLSVDQVLYLEKNFDMENKLEPERKVELAKDLGLQPRQVAIWFQNRRARFKNKQLEKDYNLLKSNYDALKAHCDSLFKDNEKLKNEALILKDKLLLKDENSKLRANHDPSIFLNTDSDNAKTNQSMEVCKQEHSTSSTKSGAFDTDLSDVSQDEEDNPICNSFINFPKLEDSDLSPDSCNFGFPTEDQPFWLWPY